MKIFHKLLILSILFLVIIFGITVYVSFWGFHSSLDKFAENSAIFLVSHFKPIINSGLKGFDLTNGLSESQDIKLRQLLLQELDKLKIVDNVLLVNPDGIIFFSLNPVLTETTYPKEVLIDDSVPGKDLKFKLTKMGEAGLFDAAWPVTPSNKYLSVIRINSKLGTLGAVLQNLKIKFYLIGFAGLVTVFILSIIGAKTLNSPIKQIEKAMSIIDKRKYGFRLKWKKDDEYADIYKKVNQALNRLEQLDSVQRKAVHRQNVIQKELRTFSRFLDIMSHEIKNPLHALGINLDVLKTKINKQQSKETTLKHVDILENETEHLQEVIQGFLSYVRPGKPQREKIQINEIIKEACRTVAAQAENSKIRIESRLSRGLRPVNVDRGQFQQALSNIIINAIYATSQGGKINIRTYTKKKKILVAVKDTGAGISRENLKKIFDLYYTTKKNGSGLGLPVTKRIIEVNGGQVLLDSKLDKGTQVTLSFPAF